MRDFFHGWVTVAGAALREATESVLDSTNRGIAKRLVP